MAQIQTPFAESVAMLQKQIAGYCLLPTDPEVLETALAGIRRAIDRLNTRNWNWAIGYDDIPFVAAQSEYPLTSWFKAARGFEIWDTSNNSQFRLDYVPWNLFQLQYPEFTTSSDPCAYSCSNFRSFGTISLDCGPSAAWVTKYPNGRLWYYRMTQYPNNTAEIIDVPSPATLFIQSWAEGYTADRYSVDKAQSAYQRAREQLKELIHDDNNVQTDWEH